MLSNEYINVVMSNQLKTIHKTYKLPFRTGEEDRFNRFLEETGRKAGPYLRVQVMKAVKSWESDLTDEVIELKK